MVPVPRPLSVTTTIFPDESAYFAADLEVNVIVSDDRRGRH